MNKLIIASLVGLFAISINAFAADAAKPATEAVAKTPAVEVAKTEAPASKAHKAKHEAKEAAKKDAAAK